MSGALSNAPATARVGYLSWLEQSQDGSPQGKNDFDLVQQKTVTFEKVAQPADGKFTLEVSPKSSVAEGAYVVFAWNDVNGNGVYEAEKGETRASEVYRVRGQATPKTIWTTEKFVFTDKKLAIEYADLNGGVGFTFP